MSLEATRSSGELDVEAKTNVSNRLMNRANIVLCNSQSRGTAIVFFAAMMVLYFTHFYEMLLAEVMVHRHYLFDETVKLENRSKPEK
jgi:hypothetical protein